MKRVFFIAALCLMGTISANAQIIGANTDGGQPVPSKPKKVVNFRKASGSHIRIEAGYPMLASVAYTHQLNQYFMLGGGLGYGYKDWEYVGYCPSYRISSTQSTNGYHYTESDRELSAIPIFVIAEARTMSWSGWSFFANVRLGYNLGLGNRKDELNFVQYDYYGDPVYLKETYSYKSFLWSAMVGWSYKNFNLAIGYSYLGMQTSISFDIPLGK